MTKGDLAGRLRATFINELDEQVRGMNGDLLELERNPLAEAPLKALFRSAHTLKGAARAAGFPIVEAVCHSLESILAKARDGTAQLGAADFGMFFAAADALADATERLQAGSDLEDSPLEALRRSLSGGPPLSPAPRGPVPTRDLSVPRAATEAIARMSPAPSDSSADPHPAPESASPARAAQPRVDVARPSDAGAELRVEPGKLDSLIAAVGELRTTASRLDARPAELESLHELAASVADRCRRYIQPLRTRMATAATAGPRPQDIDALIDETRRLVAQFRQVSAEAKAASRAVSRHAEELGQQVKTLRMRPFADACEAIPRLIRDLAAPAGKEVRVEIAGREVEADREVWKAISEAMLHLISNAVDHGLESPAARVKAGKPRAGTIRLGAEVRGDRIVVTVSDDGTGLNIPGIRAQLERSGVSVPAEDSEVVQLMFRAGISTRAEATMISGRGVGLDSVRHAVERARGTVRADSIAGGGMVFTLDCPLTLISVRAILARVGLQTVAIPAAAIRKILRVRPLEVRRLEGRDLVTTDAGPVRLVSLARLLGPPLNDEPVSGPFPVLLLSSGGRTAAIAVDEVVGDSELLVRPVKRVRNPPSYLSGAAVLPGGSVTLVLNGVVLVDAALEERQHPRITLAGEGASAARTTVLVVDDSITTRTLVQSIVEAAGYRVLTATDGADAWRLLQDHDCDLVVSDVEMPRMDGFALCEAIRASRRLHALPVVLVTGLETSSQRSRGLQTGADAYLPKSSFDEDELLETIRQLIG